MPQKFASWIASKSPYLQICMLCRFCRFPGIGYRTPDVYLLPVEYFAREKEQVHENNLPVGRRTVNHPPISSHSPRAFTIFFHVRGIAAQRVCAFNARTICIISSRKSRQARHWRDRSVCSYARRSC